MGANVACLRCPWPLLLIKQFTFLENKSSRSQPIIKKHYSGKLINAKHFLQILDEDYGPNAKIEYRISEGNGNNQFSINKDSGALTVIKELDREKTQTVNLKIAAKDLGNPSRSSTPVDVNIKVVDVNDNSPIFKGSTSHKVAENVPRRTFVFKVEAADADEGKDSKY